MITSLLDCKQVRWESTGTLSPGKHTLICDFTYDGLDFATLASNNMSGLGRAGTGVLKVDRKEVTTEKRERTIPVVLQWNENFGVGADTGTLVDGVLFAGGTLARREGPQHRSRNRAGILEARSVVSSLYSAVCRHPEAGGTQVDG